MIENKEYEQILLSALLRHPETIDVISQYVSEESFYHPFHQKVYKVILELINDNVEVNLITVAEKTGRASDVSALTELIGDPEYYAKGVRDLYIRRKVSQLEGKMKARAEDFSIPIQQVIEEADTEISHLLDQKSIAFRPVKEFLKPAISLIEERYKTGGVTGVATGFSEIDHMLGGLQKGDLVIVGARTSIGKTAFAMNVAENIASREVPVGFFSLEMSGQQITERFLCGGAKIEIKRVNTGMVTEADFARLMETGGKIDKYSLYICDEPNASLFDIKLRARRMKRKHNIKVLFVDYLSLIKITEQKPHWEKMMDITGELKSLARELDIPIVALSQVTRDAEGKPPSLADLRYSGSIEQDADVVILLHREREDSVSDAYIKKQRNGPCGRIPLHYNMKEMRFYSREDTE